MKGHHLACALILFLCTSSAWGQNANSGPSVFQSSSAPPPVPAIPPLGGLTDKEFAAITSCVPLADTVRSIAEQKSKGVRLEDVKKQYESQTDTNSRTVALNLVDKVYADNFRGAGLYSMRYLGQCAQKVANVAPNRLGVANSCLSNAHIAATASSLKKSGVSSDKAYEPFADFDGTIAASIIDKVYRSPDSAEDAGVAEWKACVISSPGWTSNQKGDEVLLAATPPGYQIGAQTKTDKVVAKHLYPQGESPSSWTEQLSLEAFLDLIDHTPTQFQKAIQGPSETCKDGKVISTSVGQEGGYAFALWSETCAASPGGKMEFRFNKVIQGHDNLYLVSKSFRFEPSEAQTQQCRAYLTSVKVCDSKKSGQPCPGTDAWRP